MLPSKATDYGLHPMTTTLNRNSITFFFLFFIPCKHQLSCISSQVNLFVLSFLIYIADSLFHIRFLQNQTPYLAKNRNCFQGNENANWIWLISEFLLLIDVYHAWRT